MIDFQDALLAHPSWDLHSLLQDARRDVSAELEAEALERYFAHRPELDREAFMADYAALAALNATRILGTFSRLAARDGKPRYCASSCRAMLGVSWRRNLRSAGAGRAPESAGSTGMPAGRVMTPFSWRERARRLRTRPTMWNSRGASASCSPASPCTPSSCPSPRGEKSWGLPWPFVMGASAYELRTAMVLAAGLGTRMRRPLDTTTGPRPWSKSPASR